MFILQDLQNLGARRRGPEGPTAHGGLLEVFTAEMTSETQHARPPVSLGPPRILKEHSCVLADYLQKVVA